MELRAEKIYMQVEKPMTKQEYYKLLIDNKDNILYDIALTNQGIIAKRLNLTPTAMSVLVYILKAL